ncbi:MAG: hypothetical protein HQ569_04520 [Actinobacteria bacterium]|nr:hypothetical protein [Actinomycetota bacterium]
MLGLGQIVWKIFDTIRYKVDPGNRLSKQQIKWLKEKKGVTDAELKYYYLSEQGYLERQRVKREFDEENKKEAG